jgi:hypothetical protein
MEMWCVDFVQLEGARTGWPCEVEAEMESRCDAGCCRTNRSNANERIAIATTEAKTVAKGDRPICNQKQVRAEVTC